MTSMYGSRRPSFSSGPSFGAGSFGDQYNTNSFGATGNQFEPFPSSSYPEVSGPPFAPPPPLPKGTKPHNGPNASTGAARFQGNPQSRGTAWPNDSMGNLARTPAQQSTDSDTPFIPPPPPRTSQPFNASGGFLPPTSGAMGAMGTMGTMPSQFGMNTREQQHPFPSDDFDQAPTTGRIPHRIAFNDSYNDSPLTDSYPPALPMHDDMAMVGRPRALSTGAYGASAIGAPPPLIAAPPMTSFPSHYSGKSHYSGRRTRRSSSVGYGMGGGYMSDGFRNMGRVHIKFRVKGGYSQGLSLHEAMSNVRLSSSSAYTHEDLGTDSRGRITLRVRWPGFQSLTYEIPISTDYDGYVGVQSLARRVARAIEHFLTTNRIHIPWDRVVIHRLEETNPGVWMPVLTTH